MLSAMVALLAASAAVGTSAQAKPHGSGNVRLNEIQVIGTHNSYHRETSEREQATYDALISTPGDYDAFLAYSMPRCPSSSSVRTCAG